MINAVIIEDEIPARQRLISILEAVAPDIEIVAEYGSVKEGVEGLKSNPALDLLFCDVQLPDGISFDIFSRVHINAPVIFITCFDKFTLSAFHNNGIEYLLKPVNEEVVQKALIKYRKLEKHFSAGQETIRKLAGSIAGHKKCRLLVKKGIEYISVKCEEVAIIYTENTITYILDNTGKKYMCDQPLNELEEELKDSIFFRANRQCIINLNYIKSFKPYEKVKLQVELNVPNFNQFIGISQKSAPDFRTWMMKW